MGQVTKGHGRQWHGMVRPSGGRLLSVCEEALCDLTEWSRRGRACRQAPGRSPCWDARPRCVQPGPVFASRAGASGVAAL